MNVLSWFRRARSRPDLHFLLYTRQGCCLCDEAHAVLEKARARHGFELSVEDVHANPEAKAAYTDCVPVVLVNGKVRFRGKVNEVLLQRILDAP